MLKKNGRFVVISCVLFLLMSGMLCYLFSEEKLVLKDIKTVKLDSVTTSIDFTIFVESGKRLIMDFKPAFIPREDLPAGVHVSVADNVSKYFMNNGNTHRFKGRVEGKHLEKLWGIGELSGYIFEGDEDNPLTFRCVYGKGYEYISGKGKVIMKDGKEITLDGQSKSLNVGAKEVNVTLTGKVEVKYVEVSASDAGLVFEGGPVNQLDRRLCVTVMEATDSAGKVISEMKDKSLIVIGNKGEELRDYIGKELQIKGIVKDGKKIEIISYRLGTAADTAEKEISKPAKITGTIADTPQLQLAGPVFKLKEYPTIIFIIDSRVAMWKLPTNYKYTLEKESRIEILEYKIQNDKCIIYDFRVYEKEPAGSHPLQDQPHEDERRGGSI